MKAADLIATLTARAAQVEDFSFNVKSTIDTDGDGSIILAVAYDERLELTDEPWTAFGDVPVDFDLDRSGMDNDGNGTVFQYIGWSVNDGMVA